MKKILGVINQTYGSDFKWTMWMCMMRPPIARRIWNSPNCMYISTWFELTWPYHGKNLHDQEQQNKHQYHSLQLREILWLRNEHSIQTLTLRDGINGSVIFLQQQKEVFRKQERIRMAYFSFWNVRSPPIYIFTNATYVYWKIFSDPNSITTKRERDLDPINEKGYCL